MIAKHRLVASAAVVVSLFSGPAPAATENVQLVAMELPTPLVRESLVRLEAELSSLGFAVIRCNDNDQTAHCLFGEAVGRIELSLLANEITLKAYALKSDEPLEQAIALSAKDVSAEVVAIRAVELLRGAMLGSIRTHQLSPDPDSSLSHFTDWEPPVPNRPSAPTQVFEPPRRDDVAASAESLQLTWSTSLGPVLSLTHFQGPPSLGVALATEFAAGPLYLGGSVEIAPWVGLVVQEDGRTEIHAYSGFARFGWNARCAPSLDCRFGLAIGLQQIHFSPQPSSGYVSSPAHHESFAAAGEVQLVWRWGPRWGAFGLLRMGALADAAVLAGHDSVTLGRPLGSLALGVTFHVDSAPDPSRH